MRVLGKIMICLVGATMLMIPVLQGIGTTLSTTATLNGDQLDQQQTVDTNQAALCREYWWAQSFVPTLGELTRVQLLLGRHEIDTDLAVSIREQIYGSDLTSVVVPYDQISRGDEPEWIEFDFENITLRAGQTYYIVAGTLGSFRQSGIYSWHGSDKDTYEHGDMYVGWDAGSRWEMWDPKKDLCFKTYGKNAPPVADAGGPYFGHTGDSLTFDGTESYDPEGISIDYTWTYHDDTTETGSEVSHVYEQEGIFNLQLTVTDDMGYTDTDTTQVYIDDTPPIVEIIRPENGLYVGDSMLLPFPVTIAIGGITIEANAVDEHTTVRQVEIFVDDEQEFQGWNEPYEWFWDDATIGGHTVRIVASDVLANQATKEIQVFTIMKQ